MRLKKAAQASRGHFVDPWMRVAHMTGQLAATAGTAWSSNPHPTDSALAQSWLAGWRAYDHDAASAPLLVQLPHPQPGSPLRGSLFPASPRSATLPSAALPMPMPSRQDDYMTTELIDRLPGMADADLSTLVTNAERLVRAGTPKQQKSAQAAMPAIQAEVAARQAKLAANPPKRAPRASRKAAALATPTAP